MSTMLWGEDEGRTARAINRRDDRARMARHVAAEFDLTIRSTGAQAGCIGYEPEVTLPTPRRGTREVDWTAVAIAAVTFGLLCGLWLGVAWLVFRRLTDA